MKCKNYFKAPLILFLILIYGTTFSQMSDKQYNYTSFSYESQGITEEMLKLIPSNYHDHPEFGKLPYNAPCENCFELIHRRTDTTKIFVEKGTNGTHFYSQATLGLVHFEKDGFTRTYDPRLKQESNGLFISKHQDTPTLINTIDEYTGFEVNNEHFKFNNNLHLYLIKSDGTTQDLGKANWSDYSVGEEGIKIKDAWDGIDITVSFNLDRIKTNYVIDKPLSYLDNFSQLKFSDNLILPTNHTLQESDDEFIDNLGNRYGSYEVLNSQGEEIFKIHKAFGYDKSGIKERSTRFYYELDETLDLFVPAAWIKSDSTVFPLIIDPLVTSTATQTAGWMSFLYNGDWCGGAGGCNYNLTVPRPANSTITGTTFDAFYESLGGYCFYACWMSEAAFKVVSPCGTSPSPTTSWNCNTANPGTCSGTGIDVFAQLGSCLGSACSGNVTFQIQNSYCYCSVGGNCGNNCQWMPNNTWSVTLEGRTLETLGETTTGNGSTSIIASSCAGGTSVTLDPTPEYGVPGYTYNWNTGETSPTINVNNFTTGDTYTADVTDACGNTVTATFEVNCPLAITLSDFYVENLTDVVRLDWTTISERNSDYFEILRSTNAGKTFEKIGVINGAGDSNEEINYTYFDKNPVNGISYYKLGMVDTDGEIEYSPIQTVNRFKGVETIVCVPNPAGEKVDIIFNYPEAGIYSIRLVSMMGQEVTKLDSKMGKGEQTTTINTSNLRSGIYQVQIRTRKHIHSTKLVIK